MGGIARRIRWIRDNLHSRSQYLLLDAGNTLFDSKHEVNQKKLAKAELLLDLYQKMDYQALAVGAYDLGSSTDFVLKKLKGSGLKTISANLSYKGKPIFTQYRILNYGQLSIGITSLTSTDISPVLSKQGIKLNDPEKCLGEILPILQKKSDLVILLSNLGQTKDLELAEKIKGIDLVIGSGPGRLYHQAGQKNNTYLLRAASKGKVISRVLIQLNDQNEVQEIQHRFEVLREYLPVDQATKERVEGLSNLNQSSETMNKEESTKNPFRRLIQNKNTQANATNSQVDQSSGLKSFLEALKKAQEKINQNNTNDRSIDVSK